MPTKESTTAGTAGRSTAHKLLGSLAVITAASAVAGLGTFGAFTDSTSVATAVESGVTSINLAVPGGFKTVPVATTDFFPGDSLSRAVNLQNDGDVGLSSVSLATTASPSSALVTDRVNGLQLTLRSCSKAWTESRPPAAPTYTCGGTERTVYAGPVMSTQTLGDPASLNPGGTDKLVFTISLPASAGNEMQGASATVSLAFTGVQRTGGAR
jgi:hypothetical protein